MKTQSNDHSKLKFSLNNEKRIVNAQYGPQNIVLNWMMSNGRLTKTNITYNNDEKTYVFLNGNTHEVKEPEELFLEVLKYCDQ